MDVVLFAWCASAQSYVEKLRDLGAGPALVVTGAAGEAGPIGAACRRLGVPVEIAVDPNAPELVARVAALGADLLVVAGCPRRLGGEIRSATRLGAVNFHPSLLPRYRGRQPLFWAVLHGETEVGVTVHHLTDEIDAGPILLQRAHRVPERVTSASLSLEVDALGATLVPELLALAAAGLPAGIPQDGPASSFPPLGPEHGRIDWSRPAEEIDRLVRACAGEIEAYTSAKGMKVIVLEAEPAGAATGEPGAMIAIDGSALVVAAGHGAVALRRLAFLNRVHDGASLAALLELRAGDRLE